MRTTRIIAMLILLVLVGSAGTYAAPRHTPPENIPATITLPPGMLPQITRHYGEVAVAAYRAALTHPEVLASVPCLCGCEESLGHKDNLACYIDGTHPNGSVTFTTHGLNCGVCITISLDAVAGAADGMTMSQLHEMIVKKYGGSH